jgi:formiminotetrahydrofolate cyclodeaminase
MIGHQPSLSFLTDLASPRPDPGGGSAAAYSALIALALTEKVTRLELRRNHAEDVPTPLWEDLLVEIQRLRENYSRLCHEDTVVYAKVAQTMRQRAEGESRKAAILEAIECPRRMMRSVNPALTVTLTIGSRCRQHLVADVLVAVDILGGALQGAYHIAMANVPWLEEQSERTGIIEQLEVEQLAGVEQLAQVRAELVGRLLDVRSTAGEL